MKLKEFFIIIKDSAISLVKRPIIILPSILLILYFNYFSIIADLLKGFFASTFASLLWLIFSVLVMAAIAALFSNSTILLFLKSKSFIRSNAKLFLNSFLIYILYYVLLSSANYISFMISEKMGQAYGFSLSRALAIFISIQLVFLLGILIFLVYAPALIVARENSFFRSIKKSISLAKKTYVYLILIGLSYFIASGLIDYSNSSLDFKFGILFEFIGLCIIPQLILITLVKIINLEK